MSPNGLNELQLFMLVGMFLLGGLTFVLGVTVLVVGVWGKDLRAVTAHTSRAAQKGLAEEISGLVGNASNLLGAINGLIQTTTGIGVFLTITGALLMGLAYWFILQFS